MISKYKRNIRNRYFFRVPLYYNDVLFLFFYEQMLSNWYFKEVIFRLKIENILIIFFHLYNLVIYIYFISIINIDKQT